jgi:hypothetical protein
MVNTVLAEGLDKETPLAEKAYAKFVDHRDLTREGLIGRVKDLKTYVDDAIDAVEVELGKLRKVPAAQRQYLPEQEPTPLPERKELHESTP